MSIRPTTRPRALVLAASTVALGLALAGCAASAAADDATTGATRTITGTATGTVEGVPDTLTVTLGVETGAPTAQQALAQNAERATGVINALKVSGVESSDVKTTQLNVFPTFDNRNRITGYHVSNAVTARLHDIPNAGAVIDAAAGQAGDDIRVQGITLSIEDTGRLMASARADAVRKARAQAGQLARAAGVRLAAVRRITEARPGRASVYPTALDVNAARSTPIEPGAQELAVDVTVVYEITDR